MMRLSSGTKLYFAGLGERSQSCELDATDDILSMNEPHDYQQVILRCVTSVEL